jgi:hypothetical protein
VRHVEVDYDAGVATIEGEHLSSETYEQAVTGAVAGRRVRRVIAHAVGLLRRDRRGERDLR